MAHLRIKKIEGYSKLILTFIHQAVPFALTSIFSLLSGFLGIMMLARLGTDYLAASSIILALQAAILTILNGIIFSSGVIIAISLGEKKYDQVGEIFRQSLLVSLFLSVIGMILFLTAENYFSFFGFAPHLLRIAQHFFYGFTFGIPANLAIGCSMQLFLATGYASLCLLIIIINCVLTIIFSYGFIFGISGISALGAFGYGLANTVSAWLTLLIILVVLKKKFLHPIKFINFILQIKIV